MKPRVRLFNYEVDPLTMDEAVDQVLAWISSRQRACRFVVTPNVNHTVLLDRHAGLRGVYRDADLVLVDGMPVLLTARLLRRPVPGRVAGSDLVPRLFEAAQPRDGIRAYLLGAAPGVAERAAQRIEATWPKTRVVGTNSPPPGFERQPSVNETIVADINRASPDVLIVGLGAPKQELWVHAHRQRLAVSVALCVGATIDFLAAEKPRAPLWMRRTGLEWMHRVATEPRRLLGRYARDGWAFVWLLGRQVTAPKGEVGLTT
ncbi:MAG TPA: WecB/TagA/CpsF family glycosyltransferase [Pirellulales bacterium]|nr:WecB/TagA/CpsF family glycosyltransferase [Pirellulales bacterium]